MKIYCMTVTIHCIIIVHSNRSEEIFMLLFVICMVPCKFFYNFLVLCLCIRQMAPKYDPSSLLYCNVLPPNTYFTELKSLMLSNVRILIYKLLFCSRHKRIQRLLIIIH